MRKYLVWTLLTILSSLFTGCLYDHPIPVQPEPIVVVITVVVTAAPVGSSGPVAIATARREPHQHKRHR